MQKKILLTGGLGFIGSHTVEHYLANTDWNIVVIDSLRNTGRADRLADIKGYRPDRVSIYWHDLRAPMHDMLKKQIGEVDYIVNIASDSHVDRSISDPVPFVKNNTALVLNMLEYCREVQPKAFVQISTDEVFGPAPVGESHAEDSPLKPSNPYSASKAVQEMIAFSYWRTYNVPLIITNTMNNFGERQDVEKFVPMSVRKILAGDVNIIHAAKRGNDWISGSRVWLHARNHADAVKYILENVTPSRFSDEVDVPDRFNIAGDKEIANDEIVRMIGGIIGETPKLEYTDFHSSRPGHDLRYSLDGAKLRNLGWKMPISTEESFERTIRWMLQHREWL